MNLHKIILALYQVDARLCAYLTDNTEEGFEESSEIDEAHIALDAAIDDLRKLEDDSSSLVRRLYPEATFERDNDGQLVIYTGQFQKEEEQA